MAQTQRLMILVCTICTIYIFFYIIPSRLSTNDHHAESLISGKVSSMHWLILHSITQLQQYLISPQPNMSVIVIGDQQQTNISNKINIIFLNNELRTKLSFRSTNAKLIAYLLAIKHGARFIYEYNPNISFPHQPIQRVAFRRQRSPFINIHATFTANFTLYSPGLPKNELTNITQDGWSAIRTVDQDQETIHPLIQQQIPLYYHNKSSVVNHPPVAIEPFTFAPFSNKNILFAYDAFWGLVLSESKSEIWRSWWVQRLLWDIGGHVIFASSAHETNLTMSTNTEENINEDADVGKLVRFLTTWKSAKPTLVERIEHLANDMTEQGLCHTNDLKVIRGWIEDLKKIKYVFPSISNTILKHNSFTALPPPPRRRRVAVCLTGLVECIEEAWRPTAQAIQTHVRGEMDVFMYLSSTEPVVAQLPTISLRTRLIEALHYSNFTVKVLFENIPTLDPHFPANCTSDSSVDQPGHKVPRYYQQLFGLSNCFDLVRDYEKKHNIQYEIMVRTRADIEFLRIPSTFDRSSPRDINKTLILPPNRYGSKVDDGFAIGPIDLVEVYMNRYHSFRQCITHDLHPERYLDFYLNYRKVNTVVDQDTLVGHIPHSPDHCH